MAEEEKIDVAAEPAPEATTTEAADDGLPSYEELGHALEQVQAKAEENWALYVGAQAEMENLRKRTQRDVENAHKFGLERFAGELLPVKDSLEMGLAAAEGATGDAEKVREGVELTLKMLAGALEKFGITEVDPVGDRFDPLLHEAMTMQESAEAEPNTVLAVIQKGYTLNERLLRPARVMVAKAPAAPPPEGPSLDVKA
jgi:molecular chaperone GrpE